MTLEAPFSSLVSFFCDPGRVRHGCVGGFARGPRSICVVELYMFMLTFESSVVTLDLPRYITCLPDYGRYVGSSRWIPVGIHGSGRCRCALSAPITACRGREAHSRVHRRHRGRHCWCHRRFGSRSPRLACWGHVRGAGSHCILGCAGKFLESTKVSCAHLLSLGSVVCILTLVLRTVFSRARDEHGAVEKALKNILLTICTVLMTPVVVVLSFCWRSTPIATVEVLFQPRLQPVESTSPLSRSRGYATCTSARIVRQWCVSGGTNIFWRVWSAQRRNWRRQFHLQ